MAIIKCKMCGGDIVLSADKTYGVCDCCGSTMTLPKIDDEQRAAAFNRGNHFRRIGEFDKALAVYERIVREDDRDAEAHWCCALCRFGIEYVEDPASFEYIPTCHRASFDSFLEDVDYLAAVEHSDGITKRQYQKDGARIAEVQRGILATSQKEEPYDVFICYKETDENGQRTRDSLMAQEIYYQLTEQGRRVFFARITLEDMAGREYEPYIFAALNSAKVMIVVGTKPEHLNAVWVKNEWSRFLAMMRHDRNKLLLPCYRDMDPYDLPEQLSVLQSYDMAKIGFIQDLTRGISKVLDTEKKAEPAAVKEKVIEQQTPASNIEPLLERVFMFLEDGEWSSADEYCEKVLDINPKCAEAYLGKLMAELKVNKRADLNEQAEPFDGNGNYQKAIRFTDDSLKATLAGYIEQIKTRNENARLEDVYNRAKKAMSAAHTESAYKEAEHLFESIREYMDSTTLAQACCEKAKIARKEEQKRVKRKKRIAIITTAIVCAVAAYIIVLNTVIIPNGQYSDAMALMDAGKYSEAITAFEALGGYKDSATKINECNVVILDGKYNEASALAEAGQYTEAIAAFGTLGDYSDAQERIFELWGKVTIRETISAGFDHTVGIKEDGTVVAIGSNEYGQCDVSSWTDIVAVSAGNYYTVGLKANGTVVAVGSNKSGKCDVSDWHDIVAVSAGLRHTVGLKADGTVVAAGENDEGQCNVSGWTDIVAISAGGEHTVGLKVDGTVVAAGSNSWPGAWNDDQFDVSDWTDIVAISAGSYYTVGLKASGSTIAVGRNDSGRCWVSDWTDIVAISAGGEHTAGLKVDGTVVFPGYFAHKVVSGWTDIVAISAGFEHTVGLKVDGTVVATGSNVYGQCDVSDWMDIKVPE